MDQNKKTVIGSIATSLIMSTKIGIDELLAILLADADPDAVKDHLQGVEVECECGGKCCGGVSVERPDERIIVLSTLAVQAERQGVSLIEHLENIVHERLKVVNEVLEFWERVEDAEDEEALEQAISGESALSPAAQEILNQIRLLVYQEEIKDKLQMTIMSALSSANGGAVH